MGGYHGGKTLKERFDEKWDAAENGCWIWRYTKGWGAHVRANTFTMPGRRATNAHKASWMIHHPEQPIGDSLVLHRCNDGRCVNPAHLYLGTHASNATDMYAAGRQAVTQRGASHSHAVLTEADVRRVRAEMHEAPRGTLARLARDLGVNKATLQDIILGKTWKHLL